MGKYVITRKVNQQRSKEGTVWNGMSNVLPKSDDYGSIYEYNLAMSQYPFIGNYFRTRNDRLAYEENQRWWSDYARHTGIDLSKVKYPIRMGLYRGYVGPYQEAFEATEAVMSLYGIKKFWEW